MVHFQEVPTGYESANHTERVEDEGANVNHEAEEEEQDGVVRSKPDGEVRNQNRF